MNDLFKHEAQSANRDRSLTTAIIDRALNAGYSIRVQDSHGDNQTRETRNRADLIEAVGTSRETTFHIIDMRRALGKNVGQITVYHGDMHDRIDRTEGRNENGPEIIASLTAPAEPVAPILDEIAAYSDDLTAAAKTTGDRKTHTDSQTGLTLEVINTGQLQEGDFIRAHGCMMQIGPITSRPEDTGHPERGATRWARGYILPQPDTGAIPRSWLDRDETGAAYWIIQGNNLANWTRFTDPAAVPIEYQAEETA
jgi:hypothetical protein